MANQGQNKSREESGSHGLVNRKKIIDSNPYNCYAFD